MYILHNALKNLWRNRGRNFLIAAVSLMIIVTTVVALIINNTSSAVIADYKNRFASEVTIAPDMQKLRDEAMENSSDGRVRMQIPQIDAELQLSFADSEYLDHTTASANMGVSSDQIQAIDQSEDEDDSSASGGTGGGPTNVMTRFGDGNYQLRGGDVWQEFSDGARSLANDEASRMPENENEAIISQDLAEANNISVGDTLQFTADLSLESIPDTVDLTGKKDGDTIEVNGLSYTLKASGPDKDEWQAARQVEYKLNVVGIYMDATEEYANENMPHMASLNSRNQILTTLDTILAPREKDEAGIQLEAVYYLKEPGMIGAFEQEVRAKGLPEIFNVSTDTASYNQVVKPVEGLKSISFAFLLVVVLLGALILVLLSALTIRERKYEVGVLRAMGMKKGKVAAGLLIETFAVTMICLILGLGIGAAVSQPVASSLLKRQAQAVEEEQANMGYSAQGMMTAGKGPVNLSGPAGNSAAEPLSEMTITIGADTIIEIILIAILLGLASGLFAVSRITKYEPIKILMERN